MIQSCIVCICWTFSSVCVQMSPQIACLREGIFTLVAFIPFLVTVCYQMFVQNACTRGNKVALAAFSPVCVFKWVLKMPVCGDAYHRRLLQGSYEVRATISRKLCSSISSILYLFITSLPQFDVAHGQALLYVGHHHVLQGKGIDLQNVVLLHLDLTPVWRSTWSGSALCVFKCLFKVFE